MAKLFDTPKHGDLIYDVGMHTAEDTEFYLRKGFRVVAFEADPELASQCKARLKAFVDTGKLKIVEGAIVDANALKQGQRKVRFFKNDGQSVWGTVNADWANRNERLGYQSSVIEVDAIDFADAVRANGVPHYMKVDIEGADMICVKTFESFEERPDYISIESNKVSYANVKHEIDTLAGLGYDNFQAVEQSTISVRQRPPEPSREGQYVNQRFEEGSSGLFGSDLPFEWKSAKRILRQYRAILLGYHLLGDDGMLTRATFRGAWRLRPLARRFCHSLTKAEVPGWYDTHARHRSSNVHAVS